MKYIVVFFKIFSFIELINGLEVLVLRCDMFYKSFNNISFILRIVIIILCFN